MCIITTVADVRQFGSIAQLGEHMPYKHGVTGSSPVVPTTLKNAQHYVLCFFYVSENNIGLE